MLFNEVVNLLQGLCDYFHRLCRDIIHCKSVIFVAILDSAGKLIIGHEKEQWPERETGSDNKALFRSVDFYRDVLLSSIQCMQDRNRKGCEISDGDFKVAALRIVAGYYIFAIEELGKAA